ncbi:MAG: hypothetical protein QE269_06115 [Fimbriimonas sp.]|nr:hypothetical protein [Fimbriimonas sp.]
MLEVPDGFGNSHKTFGVGWNNYSKDWRFQSEKVSSNTLYPVNYLWTHTITGGLETAPHLDSWIQGSLGSDVDSATLGKTSTLTSVLKDTADANNPEVTIKNEMEFHKPLENPALLSSKPYLEICSDVQTVTNLPVGSIGSVNFKFLQPAASIIGDSTVQQVVDIAIDIAEMIPRTKVVAKGAGMVFDNLKPSPQDKTQTMVAIFDTCWPASHGGQGGRMGIGINSADPDVAKHQLNSLDTVFTNSILSKFDCEIYGGSGYIGNGIVITVKPEANSTLVRGVFSFNPPGGGTPPPGTGGVTPTPGNPPVPNNN